MKNLCSVSIDSSRDVSNKNELIIACHYYDSDEKQIKHVVYDILEQNQTKSEEIFKAIKDQFQIDGVKFSNIVSFMSDNANEMVGVENSVASRFRSHNNSIFQFGCICHKFNLILVNFFKFLESEEKKRNGIIPLD